MSQYKDYDERFLETTCFYAKDGQPYFDSQYKKIVSGKDFQKALDSHTTIIVYGDEYIKPVYWGVDEDRGAFAVCLSIVDEGSVTILSPMDGISGYLTKNAENIYSSYTDRFLSAPILYAMFAFDEPGGKPESEQPRTSVPSIILYVDSGCTIALNPSKLFEFYRHGGVICANGTFINPIGYMDMPNGDVTMLMALPNGTIYPVTIQNPIGIVGTVTDNIPTDYKTYEERYKQNCMYGVIGSSIDNISLTIDSDNIYPVTSEYAREQFLKKAVVFLRNETGNGYFELLAFLKNVEGSSLSALFIALGVAGGVVVIPIKIL